LTNRIRLCQEYVNINTNYSDIVLVALDHSEESIRRIL